MAQESGKSETAKREEEVLAFWRENKTFERSLEKDAPKGEFVFYDGPPFATGLPHHGSLLSSVIKDVVPRYKTMRGYHVRRRWGWDTHGLPIESLVEKELGLKTKKDILDIGIAKFNEKARSMVLQFVNDWEKYVERIGRWVDFTNSYKTMDNSYIESVWWALKQLWDKELLYEGNKVLMYCPHCETPLAKAEIAMDNTYKDITEEAVTVKFRVKPGQKLGTWTVPDKTYILAWTTTPWTLPGNVALAVGEDIQYVVVQKDGENYIFAYDRFEKLFPGQLNTDGEEWAIEGLPERGAKVLGKTLIGLEYEPLFGVPALKSDKSYKVYAADFVTTTDGTGIVHTAVMYGEDDFALGRKEGLPMVQMLNPDGTYNDKAPELLRGKYIKDAEKDIKRDLESRGLMFKRENNTHSYPHCYRCGTPLIYNAVSSWFINIQKVKAKMLSENEKVNWVPDHLKHGRFYNIVENAPDWTISRNRFWASPLPIWKSKEGKVMVIESVDEIKRRAKNSGNQYFIMRHGEADSNVQEIVSSDINAEVHLTEKGKRQVREGAEQFKEKIDLVVASPFKRTKETTDIVASTLDISQDKIVFDPELHETNVGVWSGRPVSEWHEEFPENMERFYRAPEGGETNMQVKQRMGKFLWSLEEKYANKKILIISHGTPLLMMRAAAQGMSKEETLELYKDYPKMGAVTELPFVPIPVNDEFELDLHRPYTDDLTLLGDDGEEYTRIPEVVDCWVESGAMPFAEYHYPLENREEFEKRAPGDFIAEYIAQTRTWFYYMHAMGVTLFNRLAFKNVVSTGNILGNDGFKMSKSKGNYTDPLLVVDQFGSDAYRFHLMSSVVMQAEDFIFRDEDVRAVHNRVVGILWNTFKFFDLYQKEYDGKTDARKSEHVLDRWVLARLDEVVAEVTAAMEAYDMPRTCRAVKSFIDDYSTWYVRRSRERMKSEWHDKQYALATQKEVLLTLSKLIAPIMPFIAESIYRGIEGGGSVHLQEWPEPHKDSFFARFFVGDNKDPILEEMAKVRALVSKALEARDKAGIKVRQPLKKLTVKHVDLSDDLLDVIRDEVNVKGVEQADIENDIELDTELTDELKEEGVVRETIRAVQDARKKAGLKTGEEGKVSISVSPESREAIERNLVAIQKQTNTRVELS